MFNTILLFAPILVSHNRTKTHTLSCKHFQSGNINSLSWSPWWSLHDFHKCISFISQIVRLTAKGLSDFVLHRGFFSSVLFVFWTALSGSTCRRLLLEQYFSFRVTSKFLTIWMIIHSSIFFSEIHCMIAYDYYTFIPLYDCCYVTFVYGHCTLITGKTK